MQQGARRFIGGINLARPFGRLNRANATIPLAVLEFSADELCLGPIRPLIKILPTVHLARDQVHAVYRSTGLLTMGVAVQEAGGVHFFWTVRGRRVITELETLGYSTQPPKRPSIWRLSGWSNKPIE
jgi:hypothetical protein